ncbi:MAG: sigma-54 dependent transcriptional regulator [Planctomycetota bacterium]
MADAPGPLRVLIVDDDEIVAESLRAFLQEQGHEAVAAHRTADALVYLGDADREGVGFHAAVIDVSLPGESGFDLLTKIGRSFPTVAVVMLTGYGTVEAAVESLRRGAVDFLTKPLVDAELLDSLGRAARHQKLLEEAHASRRRVHAMDVGGVIGADGRMSRIMELVSSVAPSKTTVLMNGESGTGKSLIARAIHDQSTRADGPFVEISCGSIPETLLESELFGHVRGAFTGAHVDKVGRFEAARGGTLFLDEINSASQAMQLKLLRVLQERRFEPVGSAETIDADVRVILASNQALEDLVARGDFRQDLYYRINVVNIDLPPLRDRPADIPVLARHFLDLHEATLGKRYAGFSDEAMWALSSYSFPGNVRELSNIVERAAVLAKGQTISPEDLPEHVRAGVAPLLPTGATTGQARDEQPFEPKPLAEAMREPERDIILKTLEANGWNRQRTAEVLDINRTTLYKKMRQLGIDPEDARRAG